jgi:type II secretory pathway component PulF
MVHASELAGRLDSTFLYMASYYDDLVQTRSFFLQRISWSVMQLALALVVIGAVILIQGLLSHSPSGPAYDASGLGLSGINGFLMYCMVVIGVIAVLGTLGFGVWKNWFNCHRTLMPLVQRIPSLGTALTTLGLSRFCMSLSMLLNAGVEAQRSLKQAFLATGNYYFISGMDRALESISHGNSFGDAMDQAGVFPTEFIEQIRLGELSGTETESLDYLALQLRERAKAALTVIATIASGAIWLSVMGLIAFMVLRMAMQYLSLLNSFL